MADAISEWFNAVWDFLHNKRLVAFFLIPAFLTQIFTGYFLQLKSYAASLKFNAKNFFIYTGIACLIFGLAVIFDPSVSGWAKDASGKPAEIVWNFGAEMGRSIWIFLAFFYLILSWNPVLRGIVFGATLGTALTGLSATFLKWFVLRARPYTEEGHLSFFNWSYFGADERNYQSFPSGDVSIVAGACFFLMLIFRKNRVLSAVFFLVPFATAFARMHWNRHWFSDTVTAMILGLAWALFISGYEKFRTRAGVSMKRKPKDG